MEDSIKWWQTSSTEFNSSSKTLATSTRRLLRHGVWRLCMVYPFYRKFGVIFKTVVEQYLLYTNISFSQRQNPVLDFSEKCCFQDVFILFSNKDSLCHVPMRLEVVYWKIVYQMNYFYPFRLKLLQNPNSWFWIKSL